MKIKEVWDRVSVTYISVSFSNANHLRSGRIEAMYNDK